jgi:hypothetical protein
VRPLGYVLIPIALVAGVALGFVARNARTKTVTVVQIETTQAPPPATRILAVTVEPKGGGCITTDTNYSSLNNDTWTLRRPSNGISAGDVVAVAQSAGYAACNLSVVFKISPNLGFFTVADEQTSDSWGPFDSHQLATRKWSLVLDENN